MAERPSSRDDIRAHPDVDESPRPEDIDTYPLVSFEKEYPPDPAGRELGPHARVWQIARKSMMKHEEKRLNAWNRQIDVLLTFAGLYSAALTSFLVDAVQHLTTSTTSLTTYLNGLWFFSLSFTLLVALLCILVKQWLSEYEDIITRRAPSSQYWTRRQQLYRMDLETWQVPFIISLLPVLLHVALFLFMAGLPLRLLNPGIAFSVVSLGGTAFLIYLLQLIHPILFPLGAWRLPLVGQIYRAVQRRRRSRATKTPRAPIIWRLAKSQSTAKSGEERLIEDRAEKLDGCTLIWLLFSSSRSVLAVTTQAIGSLGLTSPGLRALRNESRRMERDPLGLFMAHRAQEIRRTRYSTHPKVTLDLLHSIRAWIVLRLVGNADESDDNVSILSIDLDFAQQWDIQLLIALISDLGQAKRGFTVPQRDSAMPYRASELIGVLERYHSVRDSAARPDLARARGMSAFGDLSTIHDASVGRTQAAALKLHHATVPLLFSAVTFHLTSTELPASDVLSNLPIATDIAMLLHLVDFRGVRNLFAEDMDTAPIVGALSRTIDREQGSYEKISGNEPIVDELHYGDTPAASTTEHPFPTRDSLRGFDAMQLLQFHAFITWTLVAKGWQVNADDAVGQRVKRLATSQAITLADLVHSGLESQLIPYIAILLKVVSTPHRWLYQLNLGDISNLVTRSLNLVTPDHSAIASLLRLAGRISQSSDSGIEDSDSSNLYSDFRYPSLAFSGAVNGVFLRDFLDDNFDDSESLMSSWEVLHGTICNDGVANRYVFSLALDLAQALEKEKGPQDGQRTSNDFDARTRRFFAHEALDHCMCAVYAHWLFAVDIAIRLLWMDIVRMSGEVRQPTELPSVTLLVRDSLSFGNSSGKNGQPVGMPEAVRQLIRFRSVHDTPYYVPLTASEEFDMRKAAVVQEWSSLESADPSVKGLEALLQSCITISAKDTADAYERLLRRSRMVERPHPKALDVPSLMPTTLLHHLAKTVREKFEPAPPWRDHLAMLPADYEYSDEFISWLKDRARLEAPPLDPST